MVRVGLGLEGVGVGVGVVLEKRKRVEHKVRPYNAGTNFETHLSTASRPASSPAG